MSESDGGGKHQDANWRLLVGATIASVSVDRDASVIALALVIVIVLVAQEVGAEISSVVATEGFVMHWVSSSAYSGSCYIREQVVEDSLSLVFVLQVTDQVLIVDSVS